MEAQEVGHTVVDVEGLANSMKKKLDSISEPPPLFHICRVPANIRKDNHVYYNPQIVSIGPFHRRKRILRAMEEHKWRYLKQVIHDHESEPQLLKRCVEEMKNMEEKARKCYAGNMLNLGKVEFVEMMLLDGCFVIQILHDSYAKTEPPEKENKDTSEKNDPIANNEWMLPLIIHDMLLLENQLPFCVLECLATCIDPHAALKKEALQFFSKNLPDIPIFKQSADNETPVPSDDNDIHHLLHLVRWSLTRAPCPTEEPQQQLNTIHHLLHLVRWCLTRAPRTTEEPQQQLNTIPTATELEEAGVVFKRNEGGSLLDVTFKNGVMRVPRIQIDDDTNSLFRNIIAFEQCFPGDGGDFTSYCFFMDSLVNTPRDVQILKQSESDIIENMLGSDEEVALFFNQLCKDIVGDFGEGSVGKACKDVNQYAATRWHKWRARLMHDYFSHPWAVISLIAAFYVIFLTSVQTYYAAF